MVFLIKLHFFWRQTPPPAALPLWTYKLKPFSILKNRNPRKSDDIVTQPNHLIMNIIMTTIICIVIVSSNDISCHHHYDQHRHKHCVIIITIYHPHHHDVDSNDHSPSPSHPHGDQEVHLVLIVSANTLMRVTTQYNVQCTNAEIQYTIQIEKKNTNTKHGYNTM